MNKNYNIPILLIIFNRPEFTKSLLNVLKEIKPKSLYVFADGPRLGNIVDTDLCTKTRNIILEYVNWDCNLVTFFSDENMGCGLGPAKAITWFFENEKMGIIFEDDCIPDLSFFDYSERLLFEFEHDESVFMISGFNPLTSWKSQEIQYLKTYLGCTYGWASWRRAWKYFDYKMTSWTDEISKSIVKKNFENKNYFNSFSNDFNFIIEKSPSDIWDFQWFYAKILNSGTTIVPSVNLIKNIGFGPNATHTFYENDMLGNLETFSIILPQVLRPLQSDKIFDWVVYERFFNKRKRSFFKKIILKVFKLLFQN